MGGFADASVAERIARSVQGMPPGTHPQKRHRTRSRAIVDRLLPLPEIYSVLIPIQGAAVTVPLGTSPAPSLFRWAKCLAILVVTGTLGAVLGTALVTLVQNFAPSPVGSSSVNYPVLLFRYVAAMGLFVFGSASGRWRVSLCRRVIPVIGSVPAAFGRVMLE
jgi:hypothetical protein